MAISSKVVQLSRVQHQVRSRSWPAPPQLPDSMVKRFPELEKFNEEFRLWAERVRNITEPVQDQSS